MRPPADQSAKDRVGPPFLMCAGARAGHLRLDSRCIQNLVDWRIDARQKWLQRKAGAGVLCQTRNFPAGGLASCTPKQSCGAFAMPPGSPPQTVRARGKRAPPGKSGRHSAPRRPAAICTPIFWRGVAARRFADRPPTRPHFSVFDTIHYQRARSVAAPAAPTRAALLPFPAPFRGGNRPVCIRNGPVHLLVVVNNGPEYVDHVL